MRFDSSDIISEINNFSETEEPSKLEQVRLAQMLLMGCIDLLTDAKLGSNTKAYIIDHLAILAGNDHGFLSRDKNLDNVIEELEDEVNESEEQEDLH